MAENAIRYLLSKIGKLPDAEDLVKKSDIVDNLSSTDTDKPLSAAQGKALNEKIDETSSALNASAKYTISASGTWESVTLNSATYYKYTQAVTAVYDACPEISLGAASGAIPTTEEITAYGLLDYATVDDTVPCLYLYAAAVPESDFVILVRGVS